MERLHPGVYVEEVPGGARPIEGVSTSTAAFLGATESGPLDGVQIVTDFAQFGATYGGLAPAHFVARAALQFFTNGGRRLYVGRVAKGARTADVTIADRQEPSKQTIVVSASSSGAWGNVLEAVIADAMLDPAAQFSLAIRRDGVTEEVFDDLSVEAGAVNFAERVVNARSRLVRVAVDREQPSTLAGTSTSAASAATTLPADRRSMTIEIDGDGARSVTLTDPVTTSGEIAASITGAVRALSPLHSSTPAAAYADFSATFAGSRYQLMSGSRGSSSAVRVTSAADADAARLLKLGAANGGSETTAATARRPAVGRYLLGDGVVAGATLAVTLGTDGETPQDSDYIAALPRLDAAQDISIVAIPGIGTPAVIDAASAYCERRMNCIFIADAPKVADTKEDAQTFVNGLTVKSSYAALYFPWLSVVGGSSSVPTLAPPSGFVAGMYARIDARRGVWKAPAGTEANLAGAIGLAASIGDAEQDTLNPIGVNVIRFFPAAGIVVWGARTLATRSDPEYRYIPIRRLAMFLEQSIYNGIQWAVFEPNDEDLWSSLRLNAGAFMLTQFRAGAFQGDTPSDAFFVNCDSQTNPQDQIDAGVVTVVVGFAPLRPAEFVVIRISQKTAEAAV